MRTPKPFYRRFNDTWYVQIGKKQIPLAKGEDNEAQAYRRYFEVMAEQPTGQMPMSLSDAIVAALADLFLGWCQKHNAPRTYQWYRDYLQDCGVARLRGTPRPAKASAFPIWGQMAFAVSSSQRVIKPDSTAIDTRRQYRVDEAPFLSIISGGANPPT